MSCECRFCGEEPKEIVVLPYERGERAGLSPYACVPCAIKNGYYCEIHDKPYIGSTEGHPFCPACVETEVRFLENEAESLYTRIVLSLCPDDLAKLKGAARQAAIISRGTEAVAVLRFVITLSHRKRISIDEAIGFATSSNAIQEILPTEL